MICKIQQWGPIATLAFNWCKAFLLEPEYILLELLFEHDSLIVMKEVYKEKVTKFMTVDRMNEGLHKLQNCCIVTLHGEVERQYIHNNNSGNFTKIVVDEKVVDNIAQHIGRLKKLNAEQKQELERQRKNTYSHRKCEKCNKKYTLDEFAFDGIKNCKNLQCGQAQLVPFEVDSKLEKNTLALVEIISRIEELIRQCANFSFPTQEDFQKSTQNQQMITESSYYPTDPLIEKFLLTKRAAPFKQSIRSRTDSYVEKKKKLLSQQMVIE